MGAKGASEIKLKNGEAWVMIGQFGGNASAKKIDRGFSLEYSYLNEATYFEFDSNSTVFDLSPLGTSSQAFEELYKLNQVSITDFPIACGT